MRGYLWSNLAEEVAGEFDSLVSEDFVDRIQLTPRVTSGPLWVGAQYWGRLEWIEANRWGKEWFDRLRAPKKKPMTQKERVAKTRARRQAEGKCTDCEEPRVGGKSRCRMHFAAHAAKARKYEIQRLQRLKAARRVI